MAENAPFIGRTLAGRFRITGYIGEGGMAAVYRGVQEGDGRNVAIKVMNAELVKDRKFVRRFRREAKAASMLKHPNTVEILEFGVDGETVYLAMECIEGLDLAMVLERDRRIPEARAANIVTQVCAALTVAHSQNIVHRDLKPDNIMVMPNPKDRTLEIVKVLDFGIAKILDEDEGPMPDPRAEPQSHAPSLLTRVGTIVGTPAYMSPEQGRAEKVDARTDVYACGVLLYELVTGRTPFGGETPMQVVMRHVNEPPLPPSQWIEIQPGLEKVILKALMKWPAERQQSAAALSDELRAVMPELATQKRPLANQGGGGRTATGDQAPPTAASGSAAVAAAGSVAANPRPAAGAPATSAPPTARASAPSLDDDNDDEPSTLMIPDGGAAALLNQRPQTGPGLTAAQAAAAADDKKLVFPTLNIDLPEDLDKAGLNGPRTTPRAAPSKQPTLESAAPIAKANESSGPPSEDDDDARTMVRPQTGPGPSLHEIMAGLPGGGLALAQTLASPIEEATRNAAAAAAKKAPPPAAGAAPPAKNVSSTLASEPDTTEGSGVHPVPAGKPAAKATDKEAMGFAQTLPIGATDLVPPREAMRSLSELEVGAPPAKTGSNLAAPAPQSLSQMPKKGLSVGMAMVLGALIGAVIVGVLVVVLVSMR